MQEQNIKLENLLTPTDLLKEFPECGYNARELGYMLMLKLLRGVKGQYATYIDKESFEQLLQYAKSNSIGKFKQLHKV